MSPPRELEDVLFYAAAQIADAAERAQFLDRACVGDAALRAAVEELLAEAGQAEAFFAQGQRGLAVAPEERDAFVATSGQAAADFEDAPGQQLGPYLLVERLGEGGCGVVYRAEQEQPLRREVALKVIKLGMDTRSVIARFAAEQQALALMEHPNIARVLDAGATRAGRPYFVMDLVRGERITAWCDAHRLDLRARLELFLQVCDAIQHAHQKGIIHRDIKPSNILVTATAAGAPMPRVIDFGIAKAITGRAPDASLATGQEQLVGTPAYMSPEQAEQPGRDADTRSDIYSLGVLLHELLTGRTPVDGAGLAGAAPERVRQFLREHEPRRPSSLVAQLPPEERQRIAECRCTDPARLAAALRNDLDWIVLKALERAPERRYQTVNGLAMDVHRHLHDEPVRAGPPGRWYRLRKLVRRHRTAFAAGAAVLAALLLGLGATSWMFVQERAARRTQVVLRAQAEEAQQREALLREQAVARETITRAAIAVSEGDYAHADRLLEHVRDYSPELSFDSVSAFRHVGEWHAIAGRWDQAAERFSALMEIDKLDTWNVITLDYQSCGVVLAESGERARFEDFCRGAIANFATTTNGDATCRILKTILLLPPSPELLEAMRPMAEVTETYWAARPPGPGHVMGWEVVPLAMWHLRRGDLAQAARLCRDRIAGAREDPALDGTCRIVLALCEAEAGDAISARQLLARVEPHIRQQFREGLKREMSAGGQWYDWLFARVLLREAEARIEDRTAAGAAD